MKKIAIYILIFILFISKSYAGFWEDLDARARKLVFPNEYNYNVWVESYNAEEYLDAVEHFMSIDCEDQKTELCFDVHHNLWNSLYYFSFEVADEVKVKNYEKAIKNYNQALNIKEDEETIKNKEFVEQKLKDLKDKLNKPNIKQKQEENNKWWWNKKNNNNNKNNNKKNKQHPKNWEDDKQNNKNSQKPDLDWNKKEEDAFIEEVPDYVDEARIWEELTEEEKESMKSRIDALLRDSAMNWNAFDKKRDESEDVRSRIFSEFEEEFDDDFWGSFKIEFWNGFDKNQEKDW